MSMEKLVERFESDKAFAEKYSKLGSLDKLLDQARADGFELTKEEVRAYVKSLNEGSLSDEDAAAVAGGKTRPSRAWSWVAGIGSILSAAGSGACATNDSMATCK
jgi:predicted ribosomally synthesized peptide with nif11-like leader